MLRLKSRFILFALLLLVAGSLLTVVQTSSAQYYCVPRTDWNIYIVQRGDTLNNIARRYGITYNDLAAANCLVNVNLIYRGQRLYVPPIGTVITPPPAPPQRVVTGSAQSFEGGYMIWRSDTSVIYVLFSNGTLRAISPAVYSRFSSNINVGITPQNRFRPILGFGQVWAGYADVRQLLGWGTSPEFGVNITIGGSIYTVTRRSNNAHLLTFNDSTMTWSSAGQFPPPFIPTPTPYVPPTQPVQFAVGTVQPFENGVMVYVANTGIIWVLYANGAGQAFSPAYYGALPLNPYSVPSPGRVSPIMGFGRLWGWDAAVRASLGWGVASESSWQGQFANGQYSFVTAYGAVIVIDTFSSRWYYASGGAPNPVPVFPTPTPLPPTPVVPAGISTYAAYQNYDNGFMIWRQDTGDVIAFINGGAFYEYTGAYINTLPENPVSAPTPGGRLRPVNAFGRVWGNVLYPTGLIGWATDFESGYTLQITFTPDGRRIFSLPNGRTVTIQYGYWVYN